MRGWCAWVSIECWYAMTRSVTEYDRRRATNTHCWKTSLVCEMVNVPLLTRFCRLQRDIERKETMKWDVHWHTTVVKHNNSSFKPLGYHPVVILLYDWLISIEFMEHLFRLQGDQPLAYIYIEITTTKSTTDYMGVGLGACIFKFRGTDFCFHCSQPHAAVVLRTSHVKKKKRNAYLSRSHGHCKLLVQVSLKWSLITEW